MRIVSSDFSRRLCAFSVFSARILNATVGVRHEQRHHRLHAELLQRLQPMVAVRREVLAVLAHDDDRIEEAADLLDDRHQLLDVRVGRVALVRRRLDAVDRQRDEQQRRAAERIAVASDDGAAVVFDLRGQPVDVGASGLARFRGGEPDGRGCGFLAADRLLAGGMRGQA